MSPRVSSLTLGVLLLLTAGAPASPRGGPLGVFEAHVDIGAPKLSGATTYNAATQDYLLTAGGTNMWGTRDEFHFAWKKTRGDFILQAQVEFVGKGVDPHRKAGWIVRQNLDADSPYADAVVHGDGLTSLQYRRARGAITEQLEAAIRGADVIQLERKGNTYTFSEARFGDPFTTQQLIDFPLAPTVGSSTSIRFAAAGCRFGVCGPTVRARKP